MRLGLTDCNQTEMRRGFEIAKNCAIEFFEEIAKKTTTVTHS